MRRFFHSTFTFAVVLSLSALAFALTPHGPTMPPDPWDGVATLHGPTMPPDPWDGLRAGHGPTMPPDPWDGVV